jgi:hypothetical protein
MVEEDIDYKKLIINLLDSSEFKNRYKISHDTKDHAGICIDDNLYFRESFLPNTNELWKIMFKKLFIAGIYNAIKSKRY